MAAELHVLQAAEVIKDGISIPLGGDLRAPLKVVTVAAKTLRAKKLITLEPGKSATLWAYSLTDPTWEFFAIRCSGTAILAIKVDKATSSSSKVPLGTAVNWVRKYLSCFAWETFTSQRAKVHTNLTTGASADFPSGLEDGWIYEIAVQNPSSTENVEIEEIRTD